MTLEQQLLIGAIGGLAAALVTSALQFLGIKLSLHHAKASDRKTDERRLRDARFIRLRTALEPALMASLAFGQVVADTQRIYAQESVEDRDRRHLKLLEDTEPGLNKARVSLMLEPVAKGLMKVLDDTILPAFTRYRSAYAFFQKHPSTEERTELEGEWKQLRDGITQFRADALKLLDELDRPI